MDKTIKYYKDRVYGVIKMYVKDPETSKAITTLTGRKTINESDMVALRKLGFEFEEVLNG